MKESLGISVSGYYGKSELVASRGYPSEGRLQKGPVAVLECTQQIPCNPCESACPRHAITVGEPITNTPTVCEDKCTGCGLCLPLCPGLAIFLVDNTYSDTLAAVSFPYEYVPLPAAGETVWALDRAGARVCEATVLRVQSPKRNDRTPIVTITVLRQYANEVRSIDCQGGFAGE